MHIISGGSANFEEGNIEQWLNDLRTLLKYYKLGDISNCDKTGLFYKILPNKTLYFKSAACHGGKKSKEGLTVLLTVMQMVQKNWLL